MGILSTVLGIATGGTSTIYKYLAIGGVALSGLVGAYFYGLHVGNLQSKIVIAQLQEKLAQSANVLNTDSNKIRDTVVKELTDTTTAITKQRTVVVMAAKNDTKTSDTLNLSQYWVCIHNAEVLQTDLAKCKE